MSLWMDDLLDAGRVVTTAGALAAPVRVVDADLPVTAADALFRADPGLACLAVRPAPPDPGWGVLSRSRFQQAMTGPLGYGRVLLARRTVAALADWDPLVVDAATDVADLARRVVDHDRARTGAPGAPGSPGTVPDGAIGVDDVLVTGPGREPRRVGVGHVFRALAAQLAVRALTDPLTGLANRDHFLQELHRRCGRRDPAVHVAVAYVDLDGFKAVNDGYGHGVGDQVLRVVADRLRGSCRPQDLPARLGGDEFAVVVDLPAGVPPERAGHELGQRLLARLAGPVTAGPLTLPGRASVGVAVTGRSPDDAQTGPVDAGTPPPREQDVFTRADELLREADLAMYRAKAAGGNGLRVVTGVGDPVVRARSQP